MFRRTKPRPRTLAAFSPVIAGIPHLAELLEVDRVLLRPSWWQASGIDVVVGWGRRTSAAIAFEYARRFKLPYLRIEDGFLRSVGLGVEGHAPCSLVVDDLGIYYDATCESRLESWLNAPSFVIPDDEIARAERCMASIRALQLSKYNHATDEVHLAPREEGQRRVLVVDQTQGDMSVTLGMIPPGGFQRMLAAALDEHPRAQILVKVHPDVLAGKKEGFLYGFVPDARVHILARHVNPIALLEQVDEVYVGTSQLGFEALMLGKPVHCFGIPFYAGWGLTTDRVSVPRRRQRRSLAEVFAAKYFRYTRYVDPRSGRRCGPEELMEYLASERARQSGDVVSASPVSGA